MRRDNFGGGVHEQFNFGGGGGGGGGQEGEGGRGYIPLLERYLVLIGPKFAEQCSRAVKLKFQTWCSDDLIPCISKPWCAV